MENSVTEKVSCLIIGSGPAGYTAAIYAARANLKPVLYQGIQPGGQLTITTEVENYPGYPDGIQGPDMMVNFEKQAQRMGADIRYGLATNVDFSSHPFKVEIDEEKWIEANAVIISTGAAAKWLGIESEQRLNGYGVSACAVCDGFFFKGKEAAIVGAGDTAAEEALYLSKICSTVHMIVRKGEMRASKIMQDRVLATANIKVYWHSETDEVLGDKKVEAVRILNTQTNEKTEIPVSAFFVAIGHKPNSDIFKGWLTMDEAGYIQTVPGTSKTNVEGVFASGDVQDKIYRQAVTAAGSGCMAALMPSVFERKRASLMFTIHLNNLKFFAFHGLHEEERIIGTDFEVSVSIIFKGPDKVLVLQDSIDYVSAYEIIKQKFEIPEKLLETLAQTIVEALYDFDKRISTINISIEKINPPINNFIGKVGISYSKSFI